MQPIHIIALILGIALAVNILLACIVVFFERRNPASTWAWLLVLFFIPILGFLIYIVFGKDAKHERVFWQKQKAEQAAYHALFLSRKEYSTLFTEQKKALKCKALLTGMTYLDDLCYLHLNSGNWLTQNNRVTHFIDGESKFSALIADIRNAAHYIHLEYYILRGDTLGAAIIHELAKKAAAGVEVKLLYDGMGCQRLPKSFFYPLQDAGGETAAFMPPSLIRLNYRDHRKLCVIDGKIGYIGGFNIGDEYLGKVKRYGPWRDTHLRIEGDAIDQLQFRFIADWNFASKKPLAYSHAYFPKRPNHPGVPMQIVSSGPDTPWNNIRNGYFKMINEAENHIYLETPYFVPDDAIFAALKVAALSGIDVRIIIPGNPDHFFVYWASTSYLWELIKSGVKCYRYEHGFIHCKITLIDGKAASVGTANMDIRSFQYNCEINAFLYDEKLTKKLERDFFHDLTYCTEISFEQYQARNFSVKVKEAVSRLISPIL